MKKFLLAVLLVASSVTMVIGDANAKRMGGGSSFGKQSQGVSRQAPTQSSNQAATAPRPAAPPAAAPAPAIKPPSPWKGILGGALLGLGMGALLSHFGMGGALASGLGSILMIGLLAAAAFFIYRMFRRKTDTAPAYAGQTPYAYEAQPQSQPQAYSQTPEIGSRIEPSAASPAALDGAAVSPTVNAPIVPFGIPADFDTAGFLRNAKTYFIRLQAAWDRADASDIREFTTPEMFAEIRMQLDERGATANNTDVINLHADMLGIEQSGDHHLASVKFSGLIKESADGAADPFTEVWNLSKPMSGSGGWVLAGIQQIS